MNRPVPLSRANRAGFPPLGVGEPARFGIRTLGQNPAHFASGLFVGYLRTSWRNCAEVCDRPAHLSAPHTSRTLPFGLSVPDENWEQKGSQTPCWAPKTTPRIGTRAGLKAGLISGQVSQTGERQ
jgi:hypothetical protein